MLQRPTKVEAIKEKKSLSSGVVYSSYNRFDVYNRQRDKYNFSSVHNAPQRASKDICQTWASCTILFNIARRHAINVGSKHLHVACAPQYMKLNSCKRNGERLVKVRPHRTTSPGKRRTAELILGGSSHYRTIFAKGRNIRKNNTQISVQSYVAICTSIIGCSYWNNESSDKRSTETSDIRHQATNCPSSVRQGCYTHMKWAKCLRMASSQ